MSYIFGKLWHSAIIWPIRKSFKCILQGVRFLLANQTRLSGPSDNELNTIMNVDILIKRISDHQLVAGLQDYEWQTSPMWFWWSSLSPLISSLPWAFCPTLSVSPFHTLSSLRAGAGLAPPFPWHPSNFHKVQKKCSIGGDDIDGLWWSSLLPLPFLDTLLTSIRWSFGWWRRW